METGVKNELYLDGAWRDVTSDTLFNPGINIRRGVSSLDSRASNSACTFTLKNIDGDYSTRNPNSPWYGSFGQSTPHRVSVDLLGDHFLRLGAEANGYISTPDSVGLSATGDLDLRMDMWLPAWSGYFTPILGKWNESTSQYSWLIQFNATGHLELAWFTGAGFLSADATDFVPAPEAGRRSIRVTLDVNNGAGGWTVTFYYGDSLTGAWTQLGDAVTGSGATSVNDSTADVIFGDVPTYLGYPSILPLAGTRLYGLLLLDGIAGSTMADPDFTAVDDGAADFTDGEGNVWTPQGDHVRYVGRDYRWWGSISKYTQNSDQSGNFKSVSVTSVDPIYVVSAKAGEADSAYRRGVTSTGSTVTDVVAYWPLEDPEGSERMSSAWPGGKLMWINGSPSLASDSSSFIASKPLPVMAPGASFGGSVVSYTPTGAGTLMFMFHAPDAGVTADTRIAQMIDDAGNRWDILIRTDGALQLKAQDSSGTSLLSTGWNAAYAMNGDSTILALSLEQNGAGVDWVLGKHTIGVPGSVIDSGNIAACTFGRCTWIAMAPDGGLDGVTIGHVTVHGGVEGSDAYQGQAAAWTGAAANDETAVGRFTRIAYEESIQAVTMGSTFNSSPIGPQAVNSISDILDEVRITDGGIISCVRDDNAILMRSRRSMSGQQDSLSVSVTVDHDVSSFAPTDDSVLAVNRAQVKRAGGGSATYEKTSGALSSAPWPDGIGVNGGSKTVSLADDSQLLDQAAWWVNSTCVDAPSFTSNGFSFEMGRDIISGDSDKFEALAALDLGDRISIVDVPASYSPDDVEQIAVGLTETLTELSWSIEVDAMPLGTFDSAVIENDVTRVDSPDSVLESGVTDVATTLSVTSDLGVLWGHSDGDFNISIDGEVMTVTAVTGTAVPQSFTVTRSVNGVVKAHSADAAVHLARGFYYSF